MEKPLYELRNASKTFRKGGLIVRAVDEKQVEERLAADCWTAQDLLRIRQISPWSLRLRSRSDP